MTKERRCGWCRTILPPQHGRGRPRKFCSQKCRQWDWVSRQRATELALSEGELVVARTELDGLHDDLYVLACAVDDTERDLQALGPKPSTRELQEILEWLLDSAKPLSRRRVSAPEAHP
jgi:hypothetical protein